MGFWTGKKVLVTGGAGFVGSHLVDILLEKGSEVSVADYRIEHALKNLAHVIGDVKVIEANLLNPGDADTACKGQDIVLNLAARASGIGYNLTHQGTVFRDNVLMNTNVLEAARVARVERFLVVSSACVYPSGASIPTPETEGFTGDPEPANYGYGWSKRIAEIQAKTYTDEFGMSIGIARPYNAYGPRDHFYPSVSHVVAAIIKRVFDGEDPVTVWGDGSQTRAFLYVRDFVRGLIETIENYPACDPVNIGTDEETNIKQLAEAIVRLSGRTPRLVFDDSKPAGMARRNCDTQKAKTKVGFTAQIGLEQGLKETINWYRDAFQV